MHRRLHPTLDGLWVRADPLSAAGVRRKHILAQGNVWGEFLRNPRDVEYFTFPRAIACQVVWSPASDRNYDEFLRRLKAHLLRLDALNVHYRRLDGRSSK